MLWRRIIRVALRISALALLCAISWVPSNATTEIILRTRYRVVLAADSRAVYGSSSGVNKSAMACKLFEVRDVYAAVSGVAYYGRSFRVTDAVKEGFSAPGTFEAHVSSTAFVLKRRLEKLLASLQANHPAEYRNLTQPANSTADIVQLAVAQTVAGHPMLGIIELRAGSTGRLNVSTTVCPGSCRQNTELFYFGYWDHIKPYVAASGRPRSVGSAAAIDRLIRMEIQAHPDAVGVPINILELNGSGARWLQNGGNCSLPGAGG